MSSFQMFAPLLLGWYWIVAPPRATQRVFGGLSAPCQIGSDCGFLMTQRVAVRSQSRFWRSLRT
jgi:hypothetical protein